MSVIKYLKKYKNITFAEEALNEVDIAVFAGMSYLTYQSPFKERKNLTKTLKTIEKASDDYYKDMYNGKGLRQYVSLVAKSKRYQDITISDYLDEIDYSKEKQFSAIVYHLTKDKHLVLFRGTDRNLISWKEDFNMSFSDNIPAQKEAVSYLNKMLLKYRGDFIVAGHSKGGNLAIYSLANCFRLLDHKIKKVYSFDAPGFTKENIDKIKKKSLRINNYHPEDTTIGLTMYNSGIREFIKSSKKKLSQHDLLSWEVKDNHFVRGEQSDFSKFVTKVLNEWIDHYEDDQKEEFVGELFDLLGAKDGKTVADIANLKAALTLFKKVGNKYNDLSKEEKEEFKTGLSKFLALGKKHRNK